MEVPSELDHRSIIDALAKLRKTSIKDDAFWTTHADEIAKYCDNAQERLACLTDSISQFEKENVGSSCRARIY